MKKTPYAIFDIKTENRGDRDRVLADIEDSGFSQSTFKSSRSDKHAGVAERASHDSAIFGLKAEVKDEKPVKVERTVSQVEKIFGVKLPDHMAGVDLKGLMAHPSLYEDPKLKDARWKKKWIEMRKKKLKELNSKNLNSAPLVGAAAMF